MLVLGWRTALLNVPMPMTTRNPVQNLPKSITAFPALSIKSSGFAHLAHMKFGNGAITNVATTSNVRKLWKRAALRMTRRKPIART